MPLCTIQPGEMLITIEEFNAQLKHAHEKGREEMRVELSACRDEGTERGQIESICKLEQEIAALREAVREVAAVLREHGFNVDGWSERLSAVRRALEEER